MTKIKILYITGGKLFDNRHRKLLSIVRNLDADKYEFSIVCPENYLLIERLKHFDIPVYAIDLPRRISSKYTNLLVKLQLGEKFNVVHSFDYASGLYSRLLKKKFPGIVCIHSSEPLLEFEYKSYLVKQVDKSTMQYLSRFTDIMICENEQDEMLAVKNKYISENCTVLIPNSVSVSGFANLKKNTEVMNGLGFDENNFIIGNISNFIEKNNQKVLIRAAYYLVKKYPQMRFVFIGSGKILNSLRELVKQSALEDYTAFVFEKEILTEYYSIFDLFVLTDLWGGSSSVLLEAMASRLPVICSNTYTYSSVAKDNFTGMVFDSKDMDELFWKIESLYKQEEKRNIIAQNAMIESTQYDDSEIFPRIESVYLKALTV